MWPSDRVETVETIECRGHRGTDRVYFGPQREGDDAVRAVLLDGRERSLRSPQIKLNLVELDLGFHDLVMHFDDGLLNLMSSTLFARFFLRLPRRSARTSLYLHSQSAAMVLRNITCGSAMLVNTQGVISVKQLTLLPGSLFNVGSEGEACETDDHADVEYRAGGAVDREWNGAGRDGERGHHAEDR